MARTDATLNLMGLTQYLDPDFWKWDDQEKSALGQGAAAILTVIVGRLEAAGCVVVSAYGIVHDRDEREVWDELQGQLVIEAKPDHLHAVIKFEKGRGGTLWELAAAIGVEHQYVEKAGFGRYAHDNMLSYLTHVKYTEKFQYAPTDVATVRGDDYLGIDAMRRGAWEKGRASIKKKQATEGFEDLWEKCFTGEVSMSQIDLTDEYARIYAMNKRSIDDALESFGRRRATRAALKMRNGDFSTTVVYVTGSAGVGKTHFANDFISHAVAQAKVAGESWDVYRAATNNPLDDWQGQEILLLDDLRASAMSATEWLLLLDPKNASPASTRYKNKQNVAPRMIVITASIEPVEFFFYVRQRGDVNEALDQFIRRLSATVEVYRQDDVQRYIVSRMGRVDPYQRVVQSRHGPERVALNHGAVDSFEMDDSWVARDGLFGELSERSPDVQLPLFDGWDEGLRQIESAPVQRQLEIGSGDPWSDAGAMVYGGVDSSTQS